MKKNTLILSMLLAGTLFFVSCSKADVTPTDEKATYKAMATTLSNLSNTKWKFVNYSHSKLAATFEKQVTLQFEALTENSIRYSGRNFVNYYGGLLKVDETKGLIIKDDSSMGSFSTLMAGPEEAMQAEDGFFKNLEKATYFEVNGSTLLLYLGDKNDKKTEVMEFAKDK